VLLIFVPDRDYFRFFCTSIREMLYSQGNFTAVPKDKNYFKLRCDTDKRVCVTVHQVGDPGSNGERRELSIERCFGLLISPGKHVRDGDMQLLELVRMRLLNCGFKDGLFALSGQFITIPSFIFFAFQVAIL
jgi:hypothetical protein